MVVPGVCFFSDRWAVRELVLLKERADEGDLSEAVANRYMNMLGRFGLTPADRAKIQVEHKAEDRLSKFLSKPRATLPLGAGLLGR